MNFSFIDPKTIKSDQTRNDLGSHELPSESHDPQHTPTNPDTLTGTEGSVGTIDASSPREPEQNHTHPHKEEEETEEKEDTIISSEVKDGEMVTKEPGTSYDGGTCSATTNAATTTDNYDGDASTTMIGGGIDPTQTQIHDSNSHPHRDGSDSDPSQSQTLDFNGIQTTQLPDSVDSLLGPQISESDFVSGSSSVPPLGPHPLGPEETPSEDVPTASVVVVVVVVPQNEQDSQTFPDDNLGEDMDGPSDSLEENVDTSPGQSGCGDTSTGVLNGGSDTSTDILIGGGGDDGIDATTRDGYDDVITMHLSSELSDPPGIQAAGIPEVEPAISSVDGRSVTTDYGNRDDEMPSLEVAEVKTTEVPPVENEVSEIGNGDDSNTVLTSLKGQGSNDAPLNNQSEGDGGGDVSAPNVTTSNDSTSESNYSDSSNAGNVPVEGIESSEHSLHNGGEGNGGDGGGGANGGGGGGVVNGGGGGGVVNGGGGASGDGGASDESSDGGNESDTGGQDPSPSPPPHHHHHSAPVNEPPTAKPDNQMVASVPGATGNGASPSSFPSREKSVFLRLSNRIENLEANMSLFSIFLDQISSR